MKAGSSPVPQARKLGLAPGLRISLDHPPPGWTLTDPPDGLVHASSGAVDVLVAFFSTADALPRRLPLLGQRIHPRGSLWVAWPRRAGGHRSDITDDVIRRHALPLGMVDVKVAAIDDDWSGQRYVWRVRNRGPQQAHHDAVPRP